MNERGRNCPLRYRYGPAALAGGSEKTAETLYVIGGLYGNLPALDAVEALAAAETTPVTLVFNGDFHWFDVDERSFAEINKRVFAHDAILGNVEAELADDGDEAGCGCAYPDDVASGIVERSNRIHARLKVVAARQPELVRHLSRLPMHARYCVGGARIGVVHGDAESLAGWRFDVGALDDVANRGWLDDAFAAARIDVFASSHTCLPALRRFASGIVINNGAAGLPNFAGERTGVLTRISLRRSPHETLYGTQWCGIHVDALAVPYDVEAWEKAFLANWPPGSDAYVSYRDRMAHGPNYSRCDAGG